MQRNFICFINPISGTKNKTSALRIIKKNIAEAGYTLEIIHTNKEGDYSFLKNKISIASISDIIICGGDGSVSQVSSALKGVDVSIGIVPMGSGNGLARTAGISANVEKAMQIILAGKGQYIDAFTINDKFSCMLAGLGLDAQVAKDFAGQTKRGLSTYIKQTILDFFSASHYPFTIYIDQVEMKTQAFFISIANSNQFGNNFTIAPQASLSDGLLDIVIVNKMNKFSMIYKVLKQLKFGKPLSFSKQAEMKNELMYFQTNKLTIKNPSLAPLHIDGEPSETSFTLKIKIIEKAFRLLVP